MKNTYPGCIEILEARIAPAILIGAGGHSATYTDVDGDRVTIVVSTGRLDAGIFTTVVEGAGEQLQKIDLSGGGFDGANLTFSVTKVAGGNGLANVGYINSTGHDLGRVTVNGDLGQIDAGDATTTTLGLRALSVRSLGRLGTDTQVGGGSLDSHIHGALRSLMVAGDVKDAFVYVTGGANGKIGAVTIGGSLIGGSNAHSGEIFSDGNMGAVKIGHDVRGGSGGSSGLINTYGNLAGVAIGGSLIGGSGNNSGEIKSSGDMGAVRIGSNVLGGSGTSTGFIKAYGKLAGVTIGGSLIGGSNSYTGNISSEGDMGAVKVGHDLRGGSISGLGALFDSGSIESGGRIADVTIGGSIISGIDNSSGSLINCASIRAASDLGSLRVAGSLVGNISPNGASPVIISARGQALPSPGVDVAIGKINIGGSVEFANILAGFDTSHVAVNGDAQIGAVNVGGDWVASNLVAGARNALGYAKFGDGNDASIGAGSAGIIAKIASITIGGQVFGTPASVNATDHFGFVAERIGSLTIGGNAVALTVGRHNDNRIVGETNDVNVHEI